MKKHQLRFLLPITLLLLALLAWGMMRDSLLARQEAENTVMLQLDGRSGQERIKLWKNGDQPDYWFFLPSYAQADALRLDSGIYPSIEIDGRICASGEMLPVLTLDTPHSIRFGKQEGQLTVTKTDPMPSMYITTRSERTDRLHDHKGAKENVNLLYLDADGSTIYTHESFKDRINVRGNTSSKMAKKPYTLTLDQQADLLGCGEAVKWVLIANATDATNLRDKIVYDFACELGMPYSPHSDFVGVYVNGIYKGLYLLSEKTEVGPNRVELETDQGYLVAADQSNKWDDMSHGFNTKYHAFEIVNKQKMIPQIREKIAARFAQIENLLMEGDADALLRLIDLDSWVRRYLIDELFLNPDGEQASTYYYWHDITSDGPLYAGPIWDYDYAMSTVGRYRDANGLLISNPAKYPWYSALMQLPVFRQRVQELYDAEYLPLAREYAETRIPELYSSVWHTVQLNKMMWAGECPMLVYDPDNEVQQVENFLADRLDFVSDYLVHPEDYRFISFLQNEQFFSMSYVVKQGSTLGGSVEDWVHYPELYEYWYYGDTGEIFDIDRPIVEDQQIYARLKPVEQVKKTASMYGFILAVCGIFGIAGLTLFAGFVVQIIREGGRRKPWGK